VSSLAYLAQYSTLSFHLQDGLQILTYHMASTYCSCTRYGAASVAGGSTEKHVGDHESSSFGIIKHCNTLMMIQARSMLPSSECLGSAEKCWKKDKACFCVMLCRTLSDPAPARYADKAARAGSFMAGNGAWQVVQPAQPGMQELQYRMLSSTGGLVGSMWYV